MTAELEFALRWKGGHVLRCTLACIFMASCVPAPQTYSAAMEGFRYRNGVRHSFPQCSSVSGDLFAASFVKPATDIGNGIVATVREGFAETDSGRYVSVVDCETGLGLRLEEQLIEADDKLGRVQTLSDDPSFKSPLERMLLGLVASGSNGSIRTISDHAASEGFSSVPWIFWEAGSNAFAYNADEVCACELYHPSIERRWFDGRKVGPDYPETLGSNPKSLSELEARMSVLRAIE